MRQEDPTKNEPNTVRDKQRRQRLRRTSHLVDNLTIVITER
jgi:hypothetical protein